MPDVSNVNIMEIAGSHLPPDIKFDIGMGDNAQPYHLTTQVLKELISIGLLLPPDASKLMDGPYWYWIRLMFAERINKIADENNDIVVGSLSHLYQVRIKDKGSIEEVLKCEKINRLRYDPIAWMSECAKCGRMKDPKNPCPLGKEITEMGKDIMYRITFNFSEVPIDLGWVDRLDAKVTSAVKGYESTFYYPVVGYDKWKEMQFESEPDKFADYMKNDLDNFLRELMRFENIPYKEKYVEEASVDVYEEMFERLKRWYI